MLTDVHKESRKAVVTVPNMTPEVRVSCLWLSRGFETWTHHFEPYSKQHLMEHCRMKSPLRINSWVCHHLENCGYSLFGWERPGGTNEHQLLYWNTKKSSCWVHLSSKCLKCCAYPWQWKDTDIWVHQRSSLYGQCFCTHQMVRTSHFQIVTCLVILKNHVTALLHHCWGTAEHHAPVAADENTCTCLQMEDYQQRWKTTLKNNSAFSNVILKF